jgi:hypothetical protein
MASPWDLRFFSIYEISFCDMKNYLENRWMIGHTHSNNEEKMQLGRGKPPNLIHATILVSSPRERACALIVPSWAMVTGDNALAYRSPASGIQANEPTDSGYTNPPAFSLKN